MKFDTYDKYLATDTELAPQALLTAWDCLAAFRDDRLLALRLHAVALTLAVTRVGKEEIATVQALA